MFVLNSDITIGKYVRVKPHHVKITKSIFEYVDRAQIQLPITARIVRDGAVITATAETAKQFTEGDKVVIKLGYNGLLKQEFEGFISRINFTAPLEIECEGYSYQLRKKMLSGTVKKIKLRDVLKKVIEGTDIVLDDAIPDFTIDKLILTGKNGVRILEELQGTSRMLIKFFFTGNKLYGGLQFLKTTGDVKYRLGWNVVKDNNLKLHQAKNQDITINWIGENKDGTKTHASTGKKGVVKTRTSHIITDKESLQQLADAEHKKLSYDGYEGKITAFGQPFCQPGNRVLLEDRKYKERGGNYIAQHVEITYGMSGFRRIIGIGEKL
jgi:hypothetical protein